MAKRDRKKPSFRLQDLQNYVGQEALLEIPAAGRQQESMWAPVSVLKASAPFGRIRLLVKPIGGRGEQWVYLERLKFAAR